MRNVVQIETLKEVALGLEELNSRVVFVGGAVIGLYANIAAPEIPRPTEDVDLTVSISTSLGLEDFRQLLFQKGIRPSSEDLVISRFRYKGIPIDVMSTSPIDWASSNRWFKHGFDAAEAVKLDEVEIKILPFPFFLATKFDAFESRGGLDARMSHDFEDIVYLLDNRRHFGHEIESFQEPVRAYLKMQFHHILNDRNKMEAVKAHLPYLQRQKRFDLIIDQITTLSG
jgi:predicted nucleotidyltransferase